MELIPCHRPRMRWILHVDMDAFFASVEQLDNPEYRGKPLMVGGEHRGVVSAASYEARKFGVHSAMPTATARRLCPHGIFVRGRMSRYKEKSREVMAVIRDFSPIVEQTSVDEAYVDITGTERLFGTSQELAIRMKAEVRAKTGLTCSIGIAPVKFMAKIASDMNKPNGITFISEKALLPTLSKLPVGKIPGIGPKAKDMLKRLGVRFVGDIQKFPREAWKDKFGERGLVLYDRAQGIDPSEVIPHSEAKSSSAETTLHEDTADKNELCDWLMAQAERVGHDLRRHNRKGRTVTLKVKYSNFKSLTRSKTLSASTDSTDLIFETAAALLRDLQLEHRVRLIGVGVTNFGHVEQQLSLLGDPEEPVNEERQKIDAALDAIRSKFGTKSVERGRTFGLGRKKDEGPTKE